MEKRDSSDSAAHEVAFMPDVHFHDLFAEFEPGSFQGLPVTYRGVEKQEVIRTMAAQLTSTRLFNENYFAFLAALDEAVKRGIKYIALPGDFSDDGQPAHVRGLMEILQRYRDKHGISFFLTPGNHDPGRPFASEAGKPDYLGIDGKQQPVFSRNHPRCRDLSGINSEPQSSGTPASHPPACTDEVKELGYEGLYDLIGEFGLKPNRNYHYYETPFSGDRTGQKALDPELFEVENRLYEICHEGSGGKYRKKYYTNCFEVMDMSYLVEPVEGLWLLALDTNVYLPWKDSEESNPLDPSNFSGSGNAGYNNVVSHKKHLIAWMEDVALRAREMGKTVISFSHFPAADFYNGAAPKIEEVWGEDEFQMIRLPSNSTTQTIAQTGIGLHIAGHMHMNGVEVGRDAETGKILTNIQVPSLAAYVPAFKIVRTFEKPGRVEAETIIMDEVPGFDTLFQLYKNEWNYLDSIGYERIWNREILESKNYRDYTNWHIRELSRLRFLPREWPDELRIALNTMTGRDLLIFSQLADSIHGEAVITNLENGQFNSDQIDFVTEESWFHANARAEELAIEAGLSLRDLAEWDGSDLSVDFYRVRNAGELALRDIPPKRIEHYSLLKAGFANQTGGTSLNKKSSSTDRLTLHQKLQTVFEVLSLFSNRLPSDHIQIDLQTGEVYNLKSNLPRIANP